MFDILSSAGHPASLQPHIDSLPVWNKPEQEQHIDARRSFELTRGCFARMEGTSRAEIDRVSLRRIQVLVDHAFERIPHYRDLYLEAGYELGGIRSLRDFASLPVIQKSDLKIIHDQVASRAETRIRFKARTSGSTGVPLSLINDTDRTRHWFVTRLHMFEHMLGAPLKREDWVYSVYYEPFWLDSIFGDYRTFSVGLNADPVQIAQHIRTLKPRIVTGVASRLMTVAKLLPDASELGIGAFTTNSETSSEAERRQVECLTGARVLDEYSSEELGIIAWESPDVNGYCVAEDTVHLELVPHAPSGLLQTVGTDLWNFTMPRIRYNQNDFAAWIEGTLEATTGPRRLARISGREDMMLISPEKGPVEAAQVLQLFDVTLVPEHSGVQEFRLVQDSMTELKLLVKASDREQSEVSIAKFRDKFEEIFGRRASLRIEYLDSLPSLGTKRRCIHRSFHA
jgi:phenylacetate-CoA ligase